MTTELRQFDQVSADAKASVAAQSIETRRLQQSHAFEQSPVVSYLDPVGSDGLALCSFTAGICGLAAVFIVSAIAFPVGCSYVSSGNWAGSAFVDRIIGIQLFTLPPAMISGVIIAATMMWYPSIIIRTITAGLALLPGVFIYKVCLGLMWNPPFRFEPLPAICLAYFTCGAGVALLAQVVVTHRVAPIRMTHLPPPKLSLRHLLELTSVAAVLAWLLIYFKVAALPTVISMAAYATLTTTVGLVSLAAFLRQKVGPPLSFLVLIVFGYIASVCVVATNAVLFFGKGAIQNNIQMILISSLWGLLFAVLSVSASAFWLRVCGWRWSR